MGLTRTERDLASYLLENLVDVVTMRQDELAGAAYVSSATVSRLAKKCGCSNYVDFRVVLAKEAEAIGGHLADKNQPFARDDTLQQIADGIYSVMSAGLMHLYNRLDFALLDAIASYISSRTGIDVYGFGTTIADATGFAEQMSKIGHPTLLFGDAGAQANRALSCEAATTAILIIMSGSNAALVNVARLLAERSAMPCR